MIEPRIIDTRMHGRDRLTACFLLRGERTALVETGPKSTAASVLAALEAEQVDRLDWIVVTHVHLDHAGAAGTLAQRFPDATVAVHEIGAPHLLDPTKLWSSASRIYGDQMERLWGGIDPIERDRIRTLSDGDEIDLGTSTLRAVETPGHAAHHHAFIEETSRIVFSGDALGVRLPDVAVLRPTTPPPEFDLELALRSIERIRDLRPASLWFTHYGMAGGAVDTLCDEARDALEQWGRWVLEAREATESLDEATESLDEATEMVRSRAVAAAEGDLPPGTLDKLEQASSYRMNTWGFMRYFDKQQS